MNLIREMRDAGTVGLSANLLLFIAVTAISMPLVLSGFETYDRLRTEENLVDEIAAFVAKSLLFFDAGGGQADISVELRDGFLRHIDFVEFGGPLSSHLCYSVRYKFLGEDVEYFFLDDYDLRMSAGDGALRLSGGMWTIHIEVINEETGDYLLLSLK